MFMTKKKWLWEALAALALATINVWMLDYLDGRGPNRLMLAQAWSGMLVVCALAYVAGVLPRKFGVETTANDDSLATSRGQAWLRIAIWTGCCAFAWITLPAGGSLGLMAAVTFYTLVWINGPVDQSKSAFRTGFAIAITGVILLLALAILGRPWRLARLITDFSGPLDLLGHHYFHGLILKVLFSLQEFTNLADSFPAHLSKTSGLELLKFASWAGALPAAFLAALILVGWHRLYLWLHATTSGAVLSPPLRHLGLGLVVMHAVTSLLNILWNFGFSRQGFGSVLPPLTRNVAWSILSASLIWLLFRAYGQHKLNSGDTERGAKKKHWHALAGSAGLAATVVIALVVSVNSAKDVYAANHTPVSTDVVRRDITDRHGTPIATSLPAFDLWLIPDQFWSTSPANPQSDFSTSAGTMADEQRRALLLKSLDDWPRLRAIVAGRLIIYGKSDEQQKILAWGIKPEVAENITATGLRGLKLTQRPIRHYPNGGLFAHALGFASLSDPMFGQDGLELTENRNLLQVVTQPSAGAPMQTTLDPELQRAATVALNEGISTHGAISGTAVVIEADTGKIRAMVSSPSFDANDDTTYRNPYQPERMLNRARGINFAVGSLLTPLLAAHMIETGRMSPSTTIAIGNKLTISQHSITDFSPTKSLSLAEVVTKSSNIGQARLALALPLTELRDVTRHLGIGIPLHIRGLTGNIDYAAIDWTKWTPQMHAQPGRYIETNLLQAMRAYLPLANGGRLGRPSLLEGASAPPQARVLSTSTVEAMREILSAAAGPTGTAPLARLPGVMVAGKTGSIVATNGQPVTAFIGMAPAGNPRWLIGVLLEFPKQQTKLAGSTAAAVFARLLEKVIQSEKAQTNSGPDRQITRFGPVEQPNA